MNGTCRPDIVSRILCCGILTCFGLVAAGCLPAGVPSRAPEGGGPYPAPMREFRGVWIATVANIDWPSRPGLSSGEQKAELRALLDRVALLNMNAVIFQVRPAADAMYASEIEPWSEYLTGEMGRPPEPYYDPLAFAVEEAHRRGLELHAWFNPFRAGHRTRTSPESDDHIGRRRPDLVIDYGEQRWLDPGEPDARDHSLAVIQDVVRRYDIDGVHMDDYFYPYPIQDDAGREIAFPDTASRRRALEQGVTLALADWRRDNIDRFVERLYRMVKAEKPWVRVGLSPFGIWRPGNPPGIRGFDAYDRIYADSRKWLQEGWVDYLTPQLYWSIESEGQPYPLLLDWWRTQNTRGRHLWPGNSIYRIEAHDWPVEQILDQIGLTRRAGSGNVLFSMRILKKNAKGLAERLLEGPYAAPALMPEADWLRLPAPGPPSARFEHFAGAALVSWQPAAGDEVWQWVVRSRRGRSWTIEILPGWRQAYRPAKPAPAEVVVSAVNRGGVEGPAVSVRLRPSYQAALPAPHEARTTSSGDS